jgi:hypothetical protein
MMDDKFTITITTTRKEVLGVSMKLKSVGIDNFTISEVV